MAFNEEPGYVFYRSGEAAPQAPGIALGADLTCELWKPSLGRIRPKGIQSGLPRLRARWLMHYLHLFATREYSIFLIRRGERPVHHSLVQPKYFRVPALARDDLEITSTWTEPEFRGRGLAAFAIQEIVRRLGSPGRHFWYLTRENNLPSIRAAEKGGLVRFAEGKRTRRLGLRILGSFVVHPMR
jgi:RimJ/RimL family protein N-acetyltransferase